MQDRCVRGLGGYSEDGDDAALVLTDAFQEQAKCVSHPIDKLPNGVLLSEPL